MQPARLRTIGGVECGKSPGLLLSTGTTVVAVGAAADRSDRNARSPKRRQRLRKLELAARELSRQHLELAGRAAHPFPGGGGGWTRFRAGADAAGAIESAAP